MNPTSGQYYHRWRPAACLRISGDDALTFLQGQFTNDLHQDGKDGAVYGLWLNQKGKVLADSFVRKNSGKEAWVVSYFSTAETIRARLEAYVIADDVVIEDVTGAMRGVTLPGVATVAELGLGAPAWAFRGRRGREPHTEIIFPSSDDSAVTASLAGREAWSPEQMERMRITAGIPAVPADIGPADLPNEGGLETGAISYTKGCYLGQEVMARLKSLGQVRRRLARVRGPGELPATPAAVFQAERKAGELRSAVRDGSDWVGLALVSRMNLRPEQGLALSSTGSPGITFCDAP